MTRTVWFGVAGVIIAGAAACGRSAPEAPPQMLQTGTLKGQQAVESLQKAYPNVHVEMAASELATEVEFSRPALVAGSMSPTDAAMKFVDQRQGLLLPSGSTAVPRIDSGDGHVVSLRQMLGNIEVFGGEIQFQFDAANANAMSQITSNVAGLRGIDITPQLKEADALKAAAEELARMKVDAGATEASQPPKLIIFSPALLGLEGPDVLTYQVDIGTFRAFVDADTGKIIHRYRNSASIAPNVFECSPRMTCLPAEPPTRAAETKTLLATLTTAYQYFLNVHKRDGFAAKLPVTGYSRYWISDAQYDSTTRQLRFSAGWVHPDIVAHEYTHGILFNGPRVEYTEQPGAVQESFADIFAALVDDSSPSRWRIGETLNVARYRHPLRDLSDPEKPGFNKTASFDPLKNAGQPAHIDQLVKVTDEICKSVDAYHDNGCVHFNGSILSLGAVRAVDGSQVNAGIGKDKFGRIAYDAMIHLPQLPSLKRAADGMREACRRSVNTAGWGISSGDCASLDAAYASVGLQ